MDHSYPTQHTQYEMPEPLFKDDATSPAAWRSFAAMRRALAVHIYDHQHLEARPWIRTKALRSCTTAAYALRHRAARTVAKFRPPEAR